VSLAFKDDSIAPSRFPHRSRSIAFLKRKTAKPRRTRRCAKKKQDFGFAQLRVLRAFAVKFFGLRAELALCPILLSLRKPDMSVEQLPFEVQEFDRLLSKPNSDPTGLAGFFNSGEVWVGRVPARLDVMGGIADYSGANVCQAVLGRGMLIALQARTDSTLRIRSMQVGRGLPVETRIPLNYFNSGDGPGSYTQVRQLCQANPLAFWAAYIGGSIFTLLKEESVKIPYGFSMLLLSAVPMNVGIGSSAAAEIGTLACLNAYLGLSLSAKRIAELGQMAENHVVGAPCGIMDQIAITSGRKGKLTHILCRPGNIVGEVEIPPGTGFVGINSMVRHSVGASPYTDTRIGAFIGKKIINDHRALAGGAPLGYLTELSVDELNGKFAKLLPNTIIGSEFLKKHRTHGDPVTTIQPDAEYRVAGPTRHPIEENERVLKFIDALRSANKGDEKSLVTAGEMMYGAHDSYKNNCNLSVEEVDFLIDAVRKRGPASGLYGAKITGGGTGGTVAVFGKLDALREQIPQIATEYSRRIGVMPDIFDGSSSGAMEFGARKYTFTANGWRAAQG
jgi:L-arabinokinase